MKALLFLCIAAQAAFASDGRIVYTKSFPGSIPAYVWIAVDRSGEVSYKEDPEDDPEKFRLETTGTDTMFDLATQLDHFKRPIESGLKVANMGVENIPLGRRRQQNRAEIQLFGWMKVPRPCTTGSKPSRIRNVCSRN